MSKVAMYDHNSAQNFEELKDSEIIQNINEGSKQIVNGGGNMFVQNKKNDEESLKKLNAKYSEALLAEK